MPATPSTVKRLVGALLLFAVACTTPPDAAEPDARDVSDWVSAVENALMPAVVLEGETLQGWTLAERMDHYSVPAVSVAVIEEGEIVWAKAWGVADTGTGSPATVETLFQAASISKPVGALAALSLVEEGRLELDAPINDYLTSWTLPDNEFTGDSAVTLRGLLTHSAGTTVWGFPGYRKDEPFRTDQALATNAHVLDGEGNTDPVRVYKVPGTSWQYSGGGYTVMEQALEDISGRSFPEVVAERVLGPAGMSLSTYEQPLPEDRWDEAARAHRGDGSEVEGEWHTYPEQAAAGLWTTPTELARVSVHLLKILDGEITDGVISQGMLEQMLTPNRDGAEGFNDHGLGFGLGEREGHASFGHGGSNAGFRANWQVLRHLRLGYAIMTNGDRGSALAGEIARSVADAGDWPINRPETKSRVTLDASVVDALSGEYEIEGVPDFEIEFRPGEDGTLEVVVPGQGTMVFYSTSADEWFETSDGDVMMIERDAEGDVVGAVNAGTTRLIRR